MVLRMMNRIQIIAIFLFIVASSLSPIAQGIRGYVVKVQVEEQLVLIDLGPSDGIQVGDLFQMVQQDQRTNIETEKSEISLGALRVVEIFPSFSTAEIVYFASLMDLEALNLLAEKGVVRLIGLPRELVEDLETSVGDLKQNDLLADGEGIVRVVLGDLVYVAGLDGPVPLWTRLNLVGEDSGTEGATLEVIKVLEEILVTRVLPGNKALVKVSDRVTLGLKTVSKGWRSRRVIQAKMVDQSPRLDGRLDDLAWEESPIIEGFLQQEPDYWMPGTERTVVQIVYDKDRIYFGINCFASEPERIVANNMRRDSEAIASDDNVHILLDPYNDRQTGLSFQVNPLGAKRDMMVSNEGRTGNADWDGVWEAKTNRNTKGWTAEVAIPFDQLRFKEGEEQVWGINLSRRISSKNEEVQLVPSHRGSITRSRYYTSDLAELRGLGAVQPKRLLQLKPYLLPGSSKDLQAADLSQSTTFETGVDLRYGITSNLTLDVSYNTDFAQVEGDQEQVNLTQFQLFFPEKREFFLQGASLFDFGEASEMRSGGVRPPTLLFYSRRIGLEEKKQVPIILGSKLVGKVSRTSVGALNVLTDLTSFPGEDNLPRSNFSVIRVKQDMFSRSYVGLIAVNKQTASPGSLWDNYNRTGGLDFSFSPTTTLNFQGFLARTWDSNLGKSANAGFFRFNYSGNLFRTRVRILDIRDHFEPKVGYVNRRSGLDGFWRYDVSLRLRKRPKKNAMNLRYFSIGPELQVITDRDDQVKYWQARSSIYTQFSSGDWFRIIVKRKHEVVDEAFAPSSRRTEIEVPVGVYNFTTVETGPFFNRGRKLRPSFLLEAGGYYTGHRYKIGLDGSYRPTGRLSLETEYEANWIRLPEGNLNIQALSARLLFSFTTEFFVKLFAQWNNDKELVSANVLVNYRFRPGSDLFLVFDEGFGTESGFKEKNRAVLMKVSYLLGL